MKESLSIIKMEKVKGKDKNRIVIHDQISEVIKTTSRTMRLLFLQVSNINIDDISSQCKIIRSKKKKNKQTLFKVKT